MSAPPRVPPLPPERWDAAARAARARGCPRACSARFLSKGPDAMRAPNAHHDVLPSPAGRAVAGVQRRPAPGPDAAAPPARARRPAHRLARTGVRVDAARSAGRTSRTHPSRDRGGRRAARPAPGHRSRRICSPPPISCSTTSASRTRPGAASPRSSMKQLLELVFVAGTYTALAMVFNSLDVELDPELDHRAGGPRGVPATKPSPARTGTPGAENPHSSASLDSPIPARQAC